MLRRVPIQSIACLALALSIALPACTRSAGSDIETAPLQGTYWQLTRLHDSTIQQLPPPRGAHIVLDSDLHRISGSGGCNQLVGTYQLSDHTITLGQMASTRMACTDGMETEDAFLAALAHVKSWSIEGKQLSLADSAGQTIAQFAARDTNVVN